MNDTPVLGTKVTLMFVDPNMADSGFLHSEESDTLRAMTEALHCELRRLNKGACILRFEP